MKTQRGWIRSIQKGYGGLKYWSYFVKGINKQLRSKKMVAEAINQGLFLYRQDKCSGYIQEFNYDTLDWDGEND